MAYQQTETKEIKRQLVSHFNHPFSVRRDRGTASHWINIRWIDGPTGDQVRSFCGQFNDRERDDIMTDLWCGSQYTSEHRDTSLAAYQWAVAEIEREYGVKVKVTITKDWKDREYGYIDNTDDIKVSDSFPFYFGQFVNQKISKTDFLVQPI